MSRSSLTVAADISQERWYEGRSAVAIVAIGIVAGCVVVYGGWIYAVGLAVIALLLRWPVEVALGSFAFLLPFDSISSLDPGATGTALTRYVGGLSALVLLMVGLATKRLSNPPRAALWWSLFVLWGVATLGWAANPEFAWQRLPTALSLLFLYLIATAFRITKKEMSAVIILAVLGGCAAAIIASRQFYGGAVFQETSRSSLMFGDRETDPNQFAASLLMPLSLALGFLMLSRSWIVRGGAITAIATLSLALLLSMSRGGLVAALAVIFVYVNRLGLSRRILVAVACLTIFLFFMPHTFFVRLALPDRGAGRFDIWLASLGLLPRYGFTRGSHSVYLGMLIEVGIIGLTFLLLAFRSQFREARNRFLVPYLAACWGMVVMGLTLDIVWRKSFWFCWILLAMAVRVRSYDEETPL
jgi:hypothetical protein